MTNANGEIETLGNIADGISTLRSQIDVILKTFQHRIWHEDRHSPLKREADAFLCNLIKDQKYSNPQRLEHYAFKVFSQNGEDGIIQEVFRRIGTKSKRFIEFGVQSGHECNTHLLLHLGWSGLWIEGEQNMFKSLVESFDAAIAKGSLLAVQSFVTIDNINSIFENSGYVGEIDLLSVDVDGNDFHLCKALDAVTPRVVVVEFNASFPPPIHWVMPYVQDYRPDSGLYFGASLTSFAEMMESKGYILVGTDICGINAVFVHKKEALEKFSQAGDVASLYNPPRYWLGLGFPTGHAVPRKWRTSV